MTETSSMRIDYLKAIICYQENGNDITMMCNGTKAKRYINNKLVSVRPATYSYGAMGQCIISGT